MTARLERHLAVTATQIDEARRAHAISSERDVGARRMTLPAFLRGGVLGRRVVEAEPIRAGHTRAWRGRVRLDDGRSVFVKAGVEPVASGLRRESVVLGWLEQHGAPSFAPRLLEWRDSEEAIGGAVQAVEGAAQEAGQVVLVLEDLSSAAWPPPLPPDAAPIFEALHRLGQLDASPEVSPLESWDPDRRARWSIVAEDPAPFLALRVCSSPWLERNIGALIAAEQRVDLRGPALVHNDIYSGNLCFFGRRVVFVDWANAARGNHWLDVAFALVSVLSEGGRPDEGAWAARLPGHNAVEAAAPLPAWADPESTLREEQLRDLRVPSDGRLDAWIFRVRVSSGDRREVARPPGPRPQWRCATWAVQSEQT